MGDHDSYSDKFNVHSSALNLELGTLNLEHLALHHCKARPTTRAGFLVHTVYSSSCERPNASI